MQLIDMFQLVTWLLINTQKLKFNWTSKCSTLTFSKRCYSIGEHALRLARPSEHPHCISLILNGLWFHLLPFWCYLDNEWSSCSWPFICFSLWSFDRLPICCNHLLGFALDSMLDSVTGIISSTGNCFEWESALLVRFQWLSQFVNFEHFETSIGQIIDLVWSCGVLRMAVFEWYSSLAKEDAIPNLIK